MAIMGNKISSTEQENREDGLGIRMHKKIRAPKITATKNHNSGMYTLLQLG